MSNLRQNVTWPIGRMVWGSMVEPQTKDAEGKPLVIKNGPDAGKATQRYAFGVAIAKGQEPHWAHTEWGKTIWAVGHAAFPGGQAQRPDFAWKVVDGDSQIPNKKGVKPCSREGYPGHWVVSFSSSFAPKTFNANGTAPVDPAAIRCGHYVQVAGTVDGNGAANQPGVYLNHSLVAHSGFGPEIISGPDPTAVGFGGPAPAAMSAVPVGGLPAAPGAPAMPGVPAAPAALPPAPAAVPQPAALPPAPAALPTPAALPPAPTVVQPHPGILNTAAVPAAPAVPAVPAAPAPGPQLTAKANGASYAQLLAAGWTDATLRAHGLMA